MHFCNIKLSDNMSELIVSQTLFTFYKVTALLYCSIQKMIAENPDEELWVSLNYQPHVDDSFVFGRLLFKQTEENNFSSIVLTPKDEGFTLTIPAEVFINIWVTMAQKHVHMIANGDIVAIVRLTINLVDNSLTFSINKLTM